MVVRARSDSGASAQTAARGGNRRHRCALNPRWRQISPMATRIPVASGGNCRHRRYLGPRWRQISPMAPSVPRPQQVSEHLWDARCGIRRIVVHRRHPWIGGAYVRHWYHSGASRYRKVKGIEPHRRALRCAGPEEGPGSRLNLAGMLGGAGSSSRPAPRWRERTCRWAATPPLSYRLLDPEPGSPWRTRQRHRRSGGRASGSAVEDEAESSARWW